MNSSREVVNIVWKSDEEKTREQAGKSGRGLCTACNGTGKFGSGFKSTCSKCNGTGQAR